MAARNTPAAGASGGRAPFPANIRLPDFIRLEGAELVALLLALRSSRAIHLFLLLMVQMGFTDGHFLSSYARLIELMTPPRPERGMRRAGPSMKQVRNALDELISVDMVRRGRDNEAQGQLRLWLAPRLKPKAIKIPPKESSEKPRPRH